MWGYWMRMMIGGEYALPQEVAVTGCELQLVNGPAAETGDGCWEGGCWDPELGLNELLYLICVRCLTVVKMMIMTTMKPMMKITMINWATWVRESGSEWLLQISLHQPKISVHQVIPKISVQRVIHGDDIDRFPWVALLMLQLQVPDKLGLWQSTPSY